jgi:hypothetical protein
VVAGGLEVSLVKQRGPESSTCAVDGCFGCRQITLIALAEQSGLLHPGTQGEDVIERESGAREQH